MKKINVTRSSMPDFNDYVEEIRDIWESRWLTNMGAKHNKLQDELCSYLGVENTSLFTNGHLALEAAINAFDLKGEVITTPFTFASTTQAIVREGLTPVFCDINDKNYTIDVNKIEALITEKTSAIVPVHVYGSICDVEKIEEIAKKYNLKVIYDSAHAFGVKYKGRGIGSFGDANMFSFHATKVFNTIEGGCITYSDSSLTKKYNIIKNFGMENAESYVEVSGNSKMNEFQAAMGLCNLKNVDGEIEKRKNAFLRYKKNLSGIDGIKIWEEQEGVTHNYSYFPVVFDKVKRDDVALKLSDAGIFARKYFYPITSSFECYQGKFEIQATQVAKEISEKILTLPLYAGLTDGDVDRICDIIVKG